MWCTVVSTPSATVEGKIQMLEGLTAMPYRRLKMIIRGASRVVGAFLSRLGGGCCYYYLWKYFYRMNSYDFW